MKTKSKGPSIFATSPVCVALDQGDPLRQPGLATCLRARSYRSLSISMVVKPAAGLFQCKPHPDRRKPVRGAQLKDIPCAGCLHQKMKKLPVFAGYAPELVSLGVHLVQQPLQLCRVAFDRTRVALRPAAQGAGRNLRGNRQRRAPPVVLRNPRRLNGCSVFMPFLSYSSNRYRSCRFLFAIQDRFRSRKSSLLRPQMSR